jgi:probable phosphoglycerate mutase
MSRTMLAPMRDDVVPRAPIYFIRHGETDWNRVGRLQGQKEIALNATGREQAAEVALHLRDLIGEKTRTLPWIVSPMARVLETAKIARHALGLPDAGYRIDPRLIELSFGSWEGMTWKEVRKADPPGALRRDKDKWGCVPPGGESYAMLLERVRAVADELTGETVIVAHGGVARTFLVHLAGFDPAEATLADIWQGRLLVFERGGAYWVP